MKIVLQSIYGGGAVEAGYRVLVDRLWPRGMSKEKLLLDEWCKEVAPSTELRKWFGHDPQRWEEFRLRYSAELATQKAHLDRLRKIAKQQQLVLLFGAHDHEHNQAVVLREALLQGR